MADNIIKPAALDHIPAIINVRPDGITESAWRRWMAFVNDERSTVRPSGYVDTNIGRIYLAEGRNDHEWITVWLTRPGMVATVTQPRAAFTTVQDRRQAAIDHAYKTLLTLHNAAGQA